MSDPSPQALGPLFAQARALSGDERTYFLAALEPGIRADLASLLAVDDDPTFLGPLRLADGTPAPTVREVIRRAADAVDAVDAVDADDADDADDP
jgi:hypothetical protein